MLKLNSNSDIADDEKTKIEQEVMETLTQALLPPLGTAMYDRVWEWVYQLVVEANEGELPSSVDLADSTSKEKEAESQPPVSPPKTVAKEPQTADEMMETSEESTTHVVSTSEAVVQGAAQDDEAKETPEETEPSDKVFPLVDKSGSLSARSSESDSPLTHESIHSKLLQQSLYGVAVCAVRCPTYFKPLYRLSSALF